MQQRLKQTYLRQTVWTLLLGSLLLVQGLLIARAQNPPSVISLTQVPEDGFLLKEGWRFQVGDLPDGANPLLDDRHWMPIDPTKDIRDLPQLQKAQIGWLRLHLRTGPDLPPLMMKVFQSVASQIYLDGRLLYHFGTVSANPERVQAYNPQAAFSFPLKAASDHILALRVALQPGSLYNTKSLNWDAGAIQYWLFPTIVLPAHKPVDVEALYLNTFRLGIAFILFILHLSLFLAHRTQPANGYAAGMYLLLIGSVWAGAADHFIHSLSGRILLHYGLFVNTWVPALALLTFYSLFNLRKGWLCWLAIGSIGFRFIPLPDGYEWVTIIGTYYLHFELIRLSVVATRRRLLGAGIILIGTLSNLALWVTFWALSTWPIPVGGHEWLIHGLFLASFLCVPLTLSLRLALEHGWVNRQLITRLVEVETLSARNRAQQAEREHLLARQNEELEVQVAQRTEKLHQQAHQLRALDEAKSLFFANITHEFRTPLSLIMAPVEKLLQQRRFDGPLLTTVHRNAEQLLRLINQLLDLSKLEGHHMAVSGQQGAVADFIHQIVAVFERAAEQKGVTLTGRLDQLPAQDSIFDADKWEKILTNLLSNALKFTPAGGHITLTGLPVWVGEELAGVQFELADSGIGIAPDKLPHIFDRFYQADTSSTRAYQGTGIGLALVNELIDLLGGTITVESQPNMGTTFRLTLPVQPVSSAADALPMSRTAPQPEAVVSPALPAPIEVSEQVRLAERPLPRILLVEDNEELRAFLVAELAPSYHVLQAEDGERGWALVQAELPDIVLTDVMMPRMDGHALTRLIKGQAQTDHIAVVMLTARSAQPSRIEGLQQGADDYLPKPFSVEELHLRLHNLLSRQAKLGEHYRQQFALPGRSEGRTPADAVDSPIRYAGAVDSPSASSDPAPERMHDPFLGSIYAVLERHLDDTQVNVDWLADQLAMSRKTLYRKVQSLIQLAPADLIRQYRLRRAADLMGAGHNVAETADRVGFSTPSHFAIVFKEFYGQTPTEFISSRPKNA
ncbi:MAG: hypothetical protein JWP57_4225 [Spirosoma sp.]|nr:hypothetical protein [Spirosoma sp.]